MVGQAVLDALRNRDDFENVWFASAEVIQNTLRSAIAGEVEKSARSEAHQMIDAYINSERLIDSIVERINRKQVG